MSPANSPHSFIDMPPAFAIFRAPFRGKFSGETCLVNLDTLLESKFYGKICKIRIPVWKQEG